MPPRKKREPQAQPERPEPAFLWERLDRPAPAPRSTLTPRRIAQAAVAIADTEGLDAVTMRRLATDLGVAPMAAYRYVSGKGELLELMVDHVYGEMSPPEGAKDWRQAMRTLSQRTRSVLLQHPWVARAAVFTLTPNQVAVVESALASLDELELDVDTMMAVCRAVDSYVKGAVDREIGLAELMQEQGWASADETRIALAPRMNWLMNTGRFPTYQRYINEATRKDDAQWQFETGLDAVLDGIAARLGI
ncbi:TetR/AcrR family transcriptional regulator [Streptomyces sp. NBS 14/10]|uniref:TetR/AcrR family transcriptional regulator n=1 Tax=Streptomyces sp. NBS 14/10 TaxID=1945643 RepID=UPI000B7FE2C4|nr:TetR/AcrR family transcriptional regulator [Streptomyces sp. NBS 14/10]KAK1178488.1 TetR/AcrR family transcriptional regulator [Streptomyces sp. NBS 14/10]NUP41126.1 TetR/AcrR family transcriptional regulator [Streptomyces sp.]NUS87770.1 TetR/AcrR family transcriptional regulator [Streptomyces sp.]